MCVVYHYKLQEVGRDRCNLRRVNTFGAYTFCQLIFNLTWEDLQVIRISLWTFPSSTSGREGTLNVS